MDLPPELTHSELGHADEPGLAARTWASACEYGREQTGRAYLRAVMRRYEGNVAEAARYAEVERESFYRLLRKHGVDPIDFRRNKRQQGGDS
jgi:transcriptional regulator of acetoin/glycerol metabolism